MTTDKYPDDLRLDKDYEQINHPNGVTTWKTKPKEQPEALRLADALNRAIQQEAPDDDVICVARWFVEDSATELRRLHALNHELLEALEETLRTLDDENAKPGGAISDTIWYSEHETLFDYLTTQITAIREALAEQPEQQESEAIHAAWMAGYTEGEREAIEKQIAQQQEPVEWGVDWGKAGDQSCVSIIKRLPGGGIEVLATEYGPPASKPWVGLSEQERNDLEDYCEMIIGKAAFESIEAKLKEKNA